MNNLINLMINKYIYLVFILLIYSVIAEGQNTVCFDIEPNPNSSDPAFSEFTKYINVFGIGIYAEDGVSNEKVKHVAAIFAEWLDNNEDSIVDNSLVLNELLSRGALMPVFEDEGSPAEISFFENYNGDGVSAVCYEFEIITYRPLVNEFDATIEENLHTISSLGYANAYPSAFSEEENSNSLLTLAMDLARGGHFTSIPNPYPPEAWYHYDDYTCDYECMATEYFYWGLTSMLGIQDYGNRCAYISNEWEPCTANQFQVTDTSLYDLLSNPMYMLPTSAPDGNYCPITSTIEEPKLNTGDIKIYPNPGEDILNIESEYEINHIQIIDSNGNSVKEVSVNGVLLSLDITSLKTGSYILHINGEASEKLIIR